MSKSYKPAIVIKAEFTDSNMAAATVASFKTKRAFLRTAGSLEGFVADFNTSTLPGGANAHLNGLTISKAILITQK